MKLTDKQKYDRLLGFVFSVSRFRTKKENELIIKEHMERTPIDHPLRNVEIEIASMSLKAINVLKEIGEL